MSMVVWFKRTMMIQVIEAVVLVNLDVREDVNLVQYYLLFLNEDGYGGVTFLSLVLDLV